MRANFFIREISRESEFKFAESVVKATCNFCPAEEANFAKSVARSFLNIRNEGKKMKKFSIVVGLFGLKNDQSLDRSQENFHTEPVINGYKYSPYEGSPMELKIVLGAGSGKTFILHQIQSTSSIVGWFRLPESEPIRRSIAQSNHSSRSDPLGRVMEFEWRHWRPL